MILDNLFTTALEGIDFKPKSDTKSLDTVGAPRPVMPTSPIPVPHDIVDRLNGKKTKGATRAVRNNNPFNIKYGRFAAKYGARKEELPAQDGGNFAVFPDVNTGLQAGRDLLLSKNYRNLTVDQALKRWSNSGYGGEIYPQIANKTIATLNDTEMENLQRAMIKREDVSMAKQLGFYKYGGCIGPKLKKRKMWDGGFIDPRQATQTSINISGPSIDPGIVNSLAKPVSNYYTPESSGGMFNSTGGGKGLGAGAYQAIGAGFGILGNTLTTSANRSRIPNKNKIVAGSALSGVGTGASIGSSILPGWGTLIGGVVGGVAGLFSGKSKARRRQREYEFVENSLDEQFNQEQLARSSYLYRQFNPYIYKYGGRIKKYSNESFIDLMNNFYTPTNIVATGIASSETNKKQYGGNAVKSDNTRIQQRPIVDPNYRPDIYERIQNSPNLKLARQRIDAENYHANKKPVGQGGGSGQINPTYPETVLLPGTPAIKGLSKAGNVIVDAINPVSGVRGSSFKSEINWGNWNKEIPRNKKLLAEYNLIEETSKANGTWMKNPDGSAFKGTPEQFVQQNSENFKKAFGNTKLINKDGSPTFQYHGGKKGYEQFLTPQDKGYIKRDTYTGDQGIYFTPSRSRAKSYSRNTPKNEREVYQTYINMENPYSGKIKGTYGKDHITNEQFEELIKNNYDGIIDKNIFPYHRQTIVFDPKKIKSAIGNNGMFDMTNPNIYKGLIPAGIIGGTTVLDQQINKKQYGGVTNPEFEVEKGEVVIGEDVKLTNSKPLAIGVHEVTGYTHNQRNPKTGGTGVYGKGSGIVFSNSIDLGNGKTPAYYAKQLAKKLGKFELDLESGDRIKRKTAEVMTKKLNTQLEELFNLQESLKVPVYKYGGKLPKYQEGGSLIGAEIVKRSDGSYWQRTANGWKRRDKAAYDNFLANNPHLKDKTVSEKVFEAWKSLKPAEREGLLLGTGVLGASAVTMADRTFNEGRVVRGLNISSRRLLNRVKSSSSTSPTDSPPPSSTPPPSSSSSIASGASSSNSSSSSSSSSTRPTSGTGSAGSSSTKPTSTTGYGAKVVNFKPTLKGRVGNALRGIRNFGLSTAALSVAGNLITGLVRDVPEILAGNIDVVPSMGGTPGSVLIYKDRSAKTNTTQTTTPVIDGTNRSMSVPSRSALLNASTQTTSNKSSRNSTTPTETWKDQIAKIDAEYAQQNVRVPNAFQGTDIRPIAPRNISSNFRTPEVRLPKNIQSSIASQQAIELNRINKLRAREAQLESAKNILPKLGLIGAGYLANQANIAGIETSYPVALTQQPYYGYADRSRLARQQAEAMTNTIARNPNLSIAQRQAALAQGLNAINQINAQENQNRLAYDDQFAARQMQIDAQNNAIINATRAQQMDLRNQRRLMAGQTVQDAFQAINTLLGEEAQRKLDKEQFNNMLSTYRDIYGQGFVSKYNNP